MTFSLNRFSRSFLILSLILAGALVMAIAPAGILADDEEATSESDRFQPVAISEQTIIDVEAIAQDLDPATLLMIYMQLQDFGELDTDLSKDSFREVDDIDDVIEHLDGNFSEPGYLPAGVEAGETRFMTGDAGYAAYTFDVAKARQISQLLDIPPTWLPDASEHPYLTVSVDVPESGLAGWKSRGDWLIVGQVDRLELNVPDEIDFEDLAASIIADPRLPDDLADIPDAIDNWENALPVPVPEDAEYQEITVNGEPGFALSIDEGSAVVWEVGETLRVVAGTYDVDELQQVAESID